MSKSLTDEQRKQMWEEIRKAFEYSSEPKLGEYTLFQIQELTGYGRNKARLLVSKLLDAEILGVRKGIFDGSSCNVFFPLKELSTEELIEILTGK